MSDYVVWRAEISTAFPVDIAFLREMASVPDYSVLDMLRVVVSRNPRLRESRIELLKVFMAAFHLSFAEAASVGAWDGTWPVPPDQQHLQQLQLEVGQAIEAHRAEWEREWDAAKR